MTVATLDTLSLIRKLAAAHRATEGACALVFDADGTLWTCDVGVDAFVDAFERGLLKESVRDALLAEAKEHGLDRATDGERVALDSLDQNALGRHLERAFELGVYAEKSATEMQAWAYGGFNEQELRAHARESLSRHQHASQIHQPLMPILIWARESNVRTVIVSASPQIVVEEAAKSLGFAAADIVAGRLRTNGAHYLPELEEPLPYGEQKAIAGRRVLGDAVWLATFGDSAFDVAMLSQAKLPVAVRPKPELVEQLPTIEGVVRLVEAT